MAAQARAKELAEAGTAPSVHTLASYERRWRQWQAFADHHRGAALPADPVHVAAFVVARCTGVSASGVAAKLAAVAWFHTALAPPVPEVTAEAKFTRGGTGALHTGSFLRTFAFGHVRQLDAVASRVVQLGAGPPTRCGRWWH